MRCACQRACSLLLDGDVEDLNVLVWLFSLWICADVADALNNLHATKHAPKHSVLVVQPRLWVRREAETKGVGEGDCVCVCVCV